MTAAELIPYQREIVNSWANTVKSTDQLCDEISGVKSYIKWRTGRPIINLYGYISELEEEIPIPERQTVLSEVCNIIREHGGNWPVHITDFLSLAPGPLAIQQSPETK